MAPGAETKRPRLGHVAEAVDADDLEVAARIHGGGGERVGVAGVLALGQRRRVGGAAELVDVDEALALGSTSVGCGFATPASLHSPVSSLALPRGDGFIKLGGAKLSLYLNLKTEDMIFEEHFDAPKTLKDIPPFMCEGRDMKLCRPVDS